MLTNLSSWDYAIIVLYVGAMLALGRYFSLRRRTDEEYFLAGRSMPWLAVGVSVIASLLSSLTYLSEPGEVWASGVTHVFGKMLAIPVEMIVVWMFCIPFLMSFRYTSAYEYLGDRFGPTTRVLGVAMFMILVVLWMGFVVLASAQALAQVTQIPLVLVIATIGVVATAYTTLGGLRAVIWTDVIQVAILIGGSLIAIGFVAYSTNSGLMAWYAASAKQLQEHQGEAIPFFSWDPTLRATVVTVAVNMTVWHICTHLSNQMTVQRYFSTSDPSSARLSFLTAAILGVAINLLLVVVGLAMLYYYQGVQPTHLVDGVMEPIRRDLIFPTFAVNKLPPGCGGAILAALLAAAMSSIDSGVNSIATVLTVELRGGAALTNGKKINVEQHHVRLAMGITVAAGIFITAAAYGLTFLPPKWGIVGSMPRTFNAITGPLGGLFLVGMFFPRVREGAAISGVLCGLATSILLGYSEQMQLLLIQMNLLDKVWGVISFTWVMPVALLVTVFASLLLSCFSHQDRDLTGLTWYSFKHPKAAAKNPANSD